MQFYLKPEGGPRLFFTVLDGCGRPVYEVRGSYSSLGCRMALCGLGGETAAHLTGVCLPGLSRYAASSGPRRVRIWIRPDAARRAVQFRGVEWRFRGSVLPHDFRIQRPVRRKHRIEKPPAHQRIGNALHADAFFSVVQRNTVAAVIVATGGADQGICFPALGRGHLLRQSIPPLSSQSKNARLPILISLPLFTAGKPG